MNEWIKRRGSHFYGTILWNEPKLLWYVWCIHRTFHCISLSDKPVHTTETPVKNLYSNFPLFLVLITETWDWNYCLFIVLRCDRSIYKINNPYFEGRHWLMLNSHWEITRYTRNVHICSCQRRLDGVSSHTIRIHRSIVSGYSRGVYTIAI